MNYIYIMSSLRTRANFGTSKTKKTKSTLLHPLDYIGTPVDRRNYQVSLETRNDQILKSVAKRGEIQSLKAEKILLPLPGEDGAIEGEERGVEIDSQIKDLKSQVKDHLDIAKRYHDVARKIEQDHDVPRVSRLAMKSITGTRTMRKEPGQKPLVLKGGKKRTRKHRTNKRKHRTNKRKHRTNKRKHRVNKRTRKHKK